MHLIVNEGPHAGASLEHTHAQLYALAFVPAEIARERERATAYHERTMGGHLLEDVVVEEVRRRERLVAIDDEAVLICPVGIALAVRAAAASAQRRASFEQDDRGAAMLQTALRALPACSARAPSSTSGCGRRRAAPRSSAGTSTSFRG